MKTGVVRGGLHVFKHRAKNIFGWGEYSDEFIVKAATKPE